MYANQLQVMFSTVNYEDAIRYFAERYVPLALHYTAPYNKHQLAFFSYVSKLLVLGVYLKLEHPNMVIDSNTPISQGLTDINEIVSAYQFTKEWILKETVNLFALLGLEDELIALAQIILNQFLEDASPKTTTQGLRETYPGDLKQQLGQLMEFINHSILSQNLRFIEKSLGISDLAYLCISNFINHLDVIQAFLSATHET